jgi:5,10-methylenetetrahydromethanopterin reductase
MNDLPNISIRVDGSMRPGECVELAKAAEAAGFTGVWFAENAFARGILPAAAACAIATEKIQINAGVFNPYSRHPAMMAMEIGALDELSNGRASISIGAGIMSATTKMGLNPEKPLPALRDALAIVRGLLRGDEVDYSGEAYAAKKVRLECPPRPDIPIYLAGRGDLTVKLAGKSADGLIVSNMCSAAFAGRLADLMRASERGEQRHTPCRVVQYMPASVGPRSSDAVKQAKRVLGEMLPRFWALGQKLGSAKEALLAGTEISEAEFADAARRLREGEDPTLVLGDRYPGAFTLSGTAEQCLEVARMYKAVGVDELALTFNGESAKDEIAAIGAAFSRASASG